MRPRRAEWPSCLGLRNRSAENAPDDLSPAFDVVERMFGIQRPPGRSILSVRDPAIGTCEVAEIWILSGRNRNTSLPALRRLQALPGCEILTGVEVIEPSDPRLSQRRLTLESVNLQYGGKTRSISARNFVIAAGVIDSNLWVSAHAEKLGLGEAQERMGSRMHDHFSVPLARIGLSGHPRLRELLAPGFVRGMVLGRHFELACERGWGARGFLHFQFGFDDVSPYREIKNLLSLRQRAASASDLVRAAGGLIAHAPGLVKLAAERVINRRLHLSDGLSVVATLDFESFPHPRQRLRLRGGHAEFSWAINDEDEISFIELSGKGKALLSEFARTYSIQVKSLVDWEDPDALRSHLHETATDAFHLGGGLDMGPNGNGLVESDLRLVGTSNVYLISTAMFGRPGVANPTHTLLALAQRLACAHSSRTAH